MTKLSDTQALILSAAAQRPELIALPLPESLRGGAAAKVVGAMLAKGFLQEVDADMRKGELVWRETGCGFDLCDAGCPVALLAEEAHGFGDQAFSRGHFNHLESPSVHIASPHTLAVGPLCGHCLAVDATNL